MKKIKIKKDAIEQRLDIYLAEVLADQSRSQVQKLIKTGAVRANGKVLSASHPVSAGEVIEIGKPTAKASQKKEAKIVSKPNPKGKLKIIAETEDYLVINKPAGVMAHGNKDDDDRANVADQLIRQYPELAKVGEDPLRPGIVHRLDKDASGLMVVAKTQDFFDLIKKQFMARQVKKRYTVLVYGSPAKDEDTINFPLERSVDGHKMAALPLTAKGEKNEDGKRAVTNFSVIKRYINYTLLRAEILTGRTHQIRAHMAAYGCPVVGDEIYNTKRTRSANQKLKLGRIFLVADYLSFADRSGQKVEFTIKLPQDLKRILGEIK